MVLIYVTAEGQHSENSSATPTEQAEKKTSVCSATDRLWISDALLLPEYKNKEKRQVIVHVSEAKEKENQEAKSPVHKEVINICMAEQMTAYFHGNVPVSPDMSGGDKNWLLRTSAWLLTESLAPLDCRSQNTSKLRETERSHRWSSALTWTHSSFFFHCYSRKMHFIHLQI